jgi:hypothetical protein
MCGDVASEETPISTLEDDRPGWILKIIDVDFNGIRKPTVQAACFHRNQVELALNSLPHQNSQTVRILIVNFRATTCTPLGASIISYLKGLGFQNVDTLRRSDVVNRS